MDIYEQILLPAAEEYNGTFDQGGQIQLSKEAPLSGPGSALDSLELLNFIVMVERRVRAASDKKLRLVTDEALSMTSSPFRTLKTLEEFIGVVLGDEGKK